MTWSQFKSIMTQPEKQTNKKVKIKQTDIIKQIKALKEVWKFYTVMERTKTAFTWIKVFKKKEIRTFQGTQKHVMKMSHL